MVTRARQGPSSVQVQQRIPAHSPRTEARARSTAVAQAAITSSKAIV